MQAGPSEDNAYAADGARPGSPKRLGRTAVHPAAATRRPNSATRGVIPGISLITITAGPEPVRKTSRRLPSASKESLVKPASVASLLLASPFAICGP